MDDTRRDTLFVQRRTREFLEVFLFPCPLFSVLVSPSRYVSTAAGGSTGDVHTSWSPVLPPHPHPRPSTGEPEVGSLVEGVWTLLLTRTAPGRLYLVSPA